ncbi:uncharacterized protein IL334_003077 [Kwoniella shivajii]|uniref:Uncharacterized protein n=1 Tax=Kwoniella shivajii TaxID=564305 RepID=A0ABZ1CYA9_9TREE|nr:hypothetical protein IL334_003077 [Kwoniella shivajii]
MSEDSLPDLDTLVCNAETACTDLQITGNALLVELKKFNRQTSERNSGTLQRICDLRSEYEERLTKYRELKGIAKSVAKSYENTTVDFSKRDQEIDELRSKLQAELDYSTRGRKPAVNPTANSHNRSAITAFKAEIDDFYEATLASLL